VVKIKCNETLSVLPGKKFPFENEIANSPNRSQEGLEAEPFLFLLLVSWTYRFYPLGAAHHTMVIEFGCTYLRG
jgi:hypothetical protein